MNLLIWIWEKSCNLIDYLTLDLDSGKSWVKKDVPAPLRSAGPSAEYTEERPALPLGYVEPKRTFELRQAYVVRRATPEEIQAAKDKLKVRALIRDVGGC